MRTLPLLMFLLIGLGIVSAVDFTPSGDINGRNIYRIYNFTNVTALAFYGDGSSLTGVSSYNYTPDINLRLLTSVFVADNSSIWNNFNNYLTVTTGNQIMSNVSSLQSAMNIVIAGLNTALPLANTANTSANTALTLAQALNVSNTTDATRLSSLETSRTSINATAIAAWNLASALNVSNTTDATRIASLETSRTSINATAIAAWNLASALNVSNTSDAIRLTNFQTNISNLIISNATKQTIGSELSGIMNWTYLQNYPAACSAGYAVTTIGDSTTCTAFAQESSNVTFTRVTVAVTNKICLNTACTSYMMNNGTGIVIV